MWHQCYHTIEWKAWKDRCQGHRVTEHGLEPYELGNGGRKSTIFRFNTGLSNSLLFVWGPLDEIRAKKNTKSTGGFIVIGAASPVSVIVSLEGARWGFVKKENISECRFEVAQDPFNSFKIERGWPVHELGDFVDGKGDARLSEGEVL